MPWDIQESITTVDSISNKKITHILSDDDIKNIVKDALHSDSGHQSADIEYSQQSYQTLCIKHRAICEIIHYIGAPSWQQKMRYLAMIAYSLHRIDMYLTSEYKLQNIISRITINVDSIGRRGVASKTIVEFNMGKIKSNKEFLWVISHEFNHIVDLGILEWTLSKLDYNYTEFGKAHFAIDDPSIDFYKLSRENENTLKPGIWYEDFVSGYSLTDPFEDFAETANLYLYHHDNFRTMSTSSMILAKKFAYMDRLYNTQIISKGVNINDLNNNTSRRPWDTTKVWLSY